MIGNDKEELNGKFNDEAANDRPDIMTDEEYEVAFKKMALDYFTGKVPQEIPELLYITGLPGAGKSSFVQEIKNKKPECADFLHINFDDLRVYHPRYEDHVRQDTVNAAARIDNAVEGLIGWLCQEAANRKLSVILDDAAMGADITKMVLSPFQAEGYVIQVFVIAVPSLIARQSVHLRFEENFAAAQAGKPVIPRWVNSAEQDNAPAALVETVETIEEGKLAKALLVLDRQYNLLYATGLHELQAAPGKIIRDELNRDLSENEKIAFQANAERIASLMRIRQQAKDAIATQPKRPAP